MADAQAVIGAAVESALVSYVAALDVLDLGCVMTKDGALDHAGFGLNRRKTVNVAYSNKLVRFADERPAFARDALAGFAA